MFVQPPRNSVGKKNRVMVRVVESVELTAEKVL